MDTAGTAARHAPVDHRSPAPLYADDAEDDDSGTDYVKWQGSQTTCSALNQLIRSSTLSELRSADADVDEPTSRGWQRQPSFDQIPGFSRLSTVDTPEPAPSSTTSQSSSAKPLRPSLARPRSSTAVEPALPLLGRASPAKFMDMLKGVSARLDLGVSGAGAPARGAKRPRRSSAESGVEARPGRAKRGRVSAPQDLERRPAHSPFHGDDSTSEAGGLALNVRNSADAPGSSRIAPRPDNPRASSSKGSASQSKMPPPALPLTSKHPSSAAPSSHIGGDGSPRVAGRLTINTSDVEAAGSRTATRPGNTRASSSTDTAPQSKMAPPAHPHSHKHPGPIQVAASSSASLISSSTTASTSPARPVSLSRDHSTTISSAPKPTPTPKLHPLLLAQKEKPAPAVPTSHPLKQQQCVAPPSVTPRPSASQSLRLSASQSSRPPALGMRRAAPTVVPVPKALPTTRKSFRPPLLAAQPPRPPPAAVPHAKHATPPFSNGSASSGSLRASTSSASSVPRSASPSPPAPRVASASARPAPPAPRFTTAAAALEVRAPSPVLPEPLDGDGDSSFGDMSFDMDALEETMRQYD
ncbi:hypothetical protein HYPSUDRAFT_87354 [Hypholoma sublateritium FD-334 SS-4]|uniref:Uncharacterized protein n=1 Tax=Hypholoma sublateritium (strain FD-334 SS-4) TaxID=945553 RepID=A0A0D2NUG6_HYPSF|nr:hypothetical protein HYPSUDRAFT_87354 [Hypholoma sublateritium FD-334 SS-4]